MYDVHSVGLLQKGMFLSGFPYQNIVNISLSSHVCLLISSHFLIAITLGEKYRPRRFT